MAKPWQQQMTLMDVPEMIQPIARKKSRDIYKANPFLAASKGFAIKKRNNVTLVAKGLKIEDQEGEDVKAGVIGRIEEVDTEEFVKLYTRNIGVLFDLSSRGQKALIAVFCAVQQAIGQGHIYLPYHMAVDYYKRLGISKAPSRSTFTNGISDLLKMGFIAGHYAGDGWYWINPNLIFNGNRIRFVTEYHLKMHEDRALQELEQRKLEQWTEAGVPRED